MKKKKDKQASFMLKQMEELEKKCDIIYRVHSYNDKDACSETEEKSYGKLWERVRALGQKIEENSWEESFQWLASNKANANYYLGRAYTEKGDYDEALIYLKRAEAHIERASLQYLVPETYVHTMICMAKCYIEKHSDNHHISDCLENASAIMAGADWERDKFWYQKAVLELDLQQAIAGLDSYGRPKKFDEEKVWSILKQAEVHFKELSEHEAEFAKELRKDPQYNQWKIKQKDTLDTTKGEHLKKLYFFAKDISHFFEEHEGTQQEKKEQIKKLRIIKEQLTDELKRMNFQEKEDEYLISLNERTDNVNLSSSQQADLIIQQAEELRKCCMEMAFRVFTGVIRNSENNTISMGNCAALLYDYHDDNRGIRFLSQLIEHYCCPLKSLGVSKEKSILENVRSILDRILEIDTNNMFALNIVAALSDDKLVSGKVNHYPALRQSSLKRRFAIVDHALDGCYAKEWKDMKINLIILHSKIVDFMNVTTIDFTKSEWSGLQVAHYSKLNVIPKLINKKGDGKLRLQNVCHLNDPMEGSLFVEHLKKEISEKNDPLIWKIVESYEPEKRSMVRNSVYMGSFTGRLDQLNMWSRYSEDGAGCCFQIEAKDFFDEASRVSLAELSTNDGPGQYKLEDTKYPLYMVLYLPEDLGEKPQVELEKKADYARIRAEKERTENKWWKKQAEMLDEFVKLKEEVTVILRKIQKDFTKIGSEKAEKMQKELINIIMAILDLARFLFKGENYKDEREYRVIQYATDPEYVENADGSPRLYVEMEKEFFCKKVCFGPKAQDFDSYATYIRNIKRDPRNGEDKKNWDIEVLKSKISYQ